MSFKDKLKKECKSLTIEQLKDLQNFIMFLKVKNRLISDEFGNVMVRVS